MRNKLLFITFPTSEGSDLLSSHVMQTPTFLFKLSDGNVIFRLDVGKNIFSNLHLSYNTVSITLKRVSKRSSFRYAFQEHVHKFLMLAVTHSELLLRDHCISRHFKFKTQLSIYQRYQPLHLPNIIFLS
jgi:hypothetical protein